MAVRAAPQSSVGEADPDDAVDSSAVPHPVKATSVAIGIRMDRAARKGRLTAPVCVARPLEGQRGV